jgi:hypothetical protein
MPQPQQPGLTLTILIFRRISEMRATHSDRIERWLGPHEVEQLSRKMRGWYGPPIALAGVPGNVKVHRDGDFSGEIRAGWEMSALDRAWDLSRRIRRRINIATGPEKRLQLNSGLASLTDLIAKSNYNRRDYCFQKLHAATAVVSGVHSPWGLGAWPPAGSAPAAAAAGTAFDYTATGAFPFTNPASRLSPLQGL